MDRKQTTGETASPDFINSYDNTAELVKKYTIEFPTTVCPGIGEKIENRLLTGFENWNRGYDAWKAWGNILYTKDSIYNVHGARLTLAEYQQAMNATLSQVNIQMGAFHNMVICDNWVAIYYDITTIVQGHSIAGKVMEFVNFRDYGKDLGVRVVEGWGSTKDATCDSMCMFQQDAEKKLQHEMDEALLKYVIPVTDNLKKKYPVANPTADHSDNAELIRQAILENFDSWNQGGQAWPADTDRFYTSNAAICGIGAAQMNPGEYRDAVKKAAATINIQKKYFNSFLINGDWAAIHYRYVSEKCSTHEKATGDAMQFFHFVKTEDGIRADRAYTGCMDIV